LSNVGDRDAEKFREIQQTVSQGRERDNIQLESCWAVQPRDRPWPSADQSRQRSALVSHSS
jgi:hypothetical protein